MKRLAAFVAGLAIVAARGEAAPRVLSADYCADQFVIALADRGQIAALSPDALKDFSYLRQAAAGLPRARASGEEIVGRDVDLVLRFWGGDAARMERLGAKVVTLGYAADFDAVKANIRLAAEALGRAAQGEALVATLEARLSALAARAGPAPNALYVTPGGVTAGSGTMIDAVFAAAGVGNAAALAGLSGWPALPAEAVVAAPPALIVTGFFSSAAEREGHWSAARHPAFARAFVSTPTLHLPADVLACPAWFSLDAAEAIRDFLDASNFSGVPPPFPPFSRGGRRER